MTLRLTTTEVADSDIRDVATYLATYNPVAAEQFESELWEAFERIRTNPDIGVLLDGYTESVRSLRVSRRFRKYLIFYCRKDEDSVEVVRILHGARDLTKLLAGL